MFAARLQLRLQELPPYELFMQCFRGPCYVFSQVEVADGQLLPSELFKNTVWFRAQKGLTKPKSHKQHQRIFWTIRGGYRSFPSKTRVFRQIALEVSPKHLAKSLSHWFFVMPFSVPNCWALYTNPSLKLLWMTWLVWTPKTVPSSTTRWHTCTQRIKWGRPRRGQAVFNQILTNPVKIRLKSG